MIGSRWTHRVYPGWSGNIPLTKNPSYINKAVDAIQDDLGKEQSDNCGIDNWSLEQPMRANLKLKGFLECLGVTIAVER